MVIEVNKELEIQIDDSNLIVKDKKLYNTETKSFEGVDGDLVSFVYTKDDGSKMEFKGRVDGYTNGGTIKVRGVDKTFTKIGAKSIDHISVVTNTNSASFEEKELLDAES